MLRRHRAGSDWRHRRVDDVDVDVVVDRVIVDDEHDVRLVERRLRVLIAPA